VTGARRSRPVARAMIAPEGLGPSGSQTATASRLHTGDRGGRRPPTACRSPPSGATFRSPPRSSREPSRGPSSLALASSRGAGGAGRSWSGSLTSRRRCGAIDPGPRNESSRVQPAARRRAVGSAHSGTEPGRDPPMLRGYRPACEQQAVRSALPLRSDPRRDGSPGRRHGPRRAPYRGRRRSVLTVHGRGATLP
jgi:hypothetical protein